LGARFEVVTVHETQYRPRFWPTRAETMAHEIRSFDWSAESQRFGPNGTATPAIVVGGMHRSGTSALTRALALAGADLPSTLMAPGSDNPLGFWESIPIAEVNDAVLAETGSHWDDVFGFSTRPEAAPLRQASIASIRQAMRAEFGAATLPIIKDPRISLILPMGYRPARGRSRPARHRAGAASDGGRAIAGPSQWLPDRQIAAVVDRLHGGLRTRQPLDAAGFCQL